MLPVWQRTAWKRWLGVVGTAGLLIAGMTLLITVWQEGIFAVQVGNWAAPFGITLVADLLSALMVVLIGLVGVAAAIYALPALRSRRSALVFTRSCRFCSWA
jgi:multicomponent Na+:H+ antiporter subunit D